MKMRVSVLRAWILGLAAAVFVALFTPYSDLVMQGTWVGLTSFPISAFFVLCILVGFNALLSRLSKGLKPAELLLAYAMALVAAGIPFFRLDRVAHSLPCWTVLFRHTRKQLGTNPAPAPAEISVSAAERNCRLALRRFAERCANPLARLVAAVGYVDTVWRLRLHGVLLLERFGAKTLG